jgi:hypothetical protein
MKRLIVTSIAVLSGCLGNWSNEDLEFASALPLKSELQSKLPTTAAQPLSGEGTRRDPLGIGEASQSYLEAKKASNDFNGLLDGLLSIVEAVRNLAPTTREENARTWGPFPDDKNPGYEVVLIITRVDPTHFDWAIKYRQRQPQGDWFDVVTGTFASSGGIRKGKGTVVIFIAENAARLKTLQAFSPIARITTAYVTDEDPITVGMQFTFSANDAGYSELGYGYRENVDKAGKIAFGLRTNDPNVTLLNTAAGWLPDGSGQATANVAEGAYTGAQAVECWDNQFKTTYVFQNWPGGVNLGSAANCVTLPF